MTFGSVVRRLLALLIVLGVAASSWTLWARSRIPQAGSASELVVRLETVYESSRLHGISVDRLLDAFREAGVTTVAVEAKSLARMEHDGQAALVYDPGTGLYNVTLIGSVGAAPADDASLSGSINPVAARGSNGAAPALSADLSAWLARELDRWAPRHRVEAGHLGQGSVAVALPAYYPPRRKDLVLPSASVLRKAADPLAVTPPERDLLLGISPADVALARRHGFLLAAFLPNRPGITEREALWMLEGLGDGAGFSALKFDGETALGWPDQGALAAVGKRLGELGVPFVVDDEPEAGLATVARAAGWRGVRQQPVWTRVEPGRFPEVAVERRQHFLYLQSAFFDGTSPDWLTQVTSGMRAVVSAMEASGLAMAKTVPFTPYAPSRGPLAVAVSGVLAAVVLGLLLAGEAPARGRTGKSPGRPAGFGAYRLSLPWPRVALVSLLGLLWAVPVLTILARGSDPSGLTLRVQLATGFLAVVIFPLLGLGLALEYGPAAGETPSVPAGRSPRALRAATVTVGVAALAVAGGLLTTAIGSNTTFMLRLEMFRGTKLSLLLPPVAAGFLFLGLVGLYPQPEAQGSGAGPAGKSILARGLEQLGLFLAEDVTFIYVFLFSLAAVAALVMVMRSGNFPTLPIPALELKLRAFLQQTLLVRPRTKEFLIGYPSLVLLVYWGARWRERIWTRWTALVLVVGASIGLVSIGNTFAHQHVPVSISLLRTVNGLVLGLPIGLVAATATGVAVRVWGRRRAPALGLSARGGRKSSS